MILGKKIYPVKSVCTKTVIISTFFFILCSNFFLPESNIINTEEKLQKPSLTHLFGTDQFGRDVFLRTVHGFRSTFSLALIVIGISFPAGLCIGLLLGYYGGLIDDLFYHLSNFILSFPVIILALLIASLTDADITYLLMTIIITMIITVSKIVRSEILIIKNAEYIKTLRILGLGNYHIITHHLALKAVKLLMPLTSLFTGHIIIGISTFSFMGFGVKPPQPEIGNMLHESMRFISTAPHLMLLPGCFQFFSILLLLNLITKRQH